MLKWHEPNWTLAGNTSKDLYILRRCVRNCAVFPPPCIGSIKPGLLSVHLTMVSSPNHHHPFLFLFFNFDLMITLRSVFTQSSFLNGGCWFSVDLYSTNQRTLKSLMVPLVTGRGYPEVGTKKVLQNGVELRERSDCSVPAVWGHKKGGTSSNRSKNYENVLPVHKHISSTLLT